MNSPSTGKKSLRFDLYEKEKSQCHKSHCSFSGVFGFGSSKPENSFCEFIRVSYSFNFMRIKYFTSGEIHFQRANILHWSMSIDVNFGAAYFALQNSFFILRTSNFPLNTFHFSG